MPHLAPLVAKYAAGAVAFFAAFAAVAIIVDRLEQRYGPVPPAVLIAALIGVTLTLAALAGGH